MSAQVEQMRAIVGELDTLVSGAGGQANRFLAANILGRLRKNLLNKLKEIIQSSRLKSKKPIFYYEEFGGLHAIFS
jgi:hypothetical protein